MGPNATSMMLRLAKRAIEESVSASREQSLALTRLEEAELWYQRALDNEPNTTAAPLAATSSSSTSFHDAAAKRRVVDAPQA